MLTLDEAIQHCLEVADGQTEQGRCPECAEEHRQLAEWLTDYKRLLEQQSCKDEDITAESIAKAFQFGMAFGFAKKYDEMDKVMEEVKKAITPQQEPCEDCISRQAVLDLIEHYNSDGLGTVFIDYEHGKRFEKEIKSLPSVNPQPEMGRWLPIEYDGYADGDPVWDKWECSECGWEHSGDEESLTAFCPNCGAKMVEPQEGKE